VSKTTFTSRTNVQYYIYEVRNSCITRTYGTIEDVAVVNETRPTFGLHFLAVRKYIGLNSDYDPLLLHILFFIVTVSNTS
jgi:hypothetical protein